MLLLLLLLCNRPSYPFISNRVLNDTQAHPTFPVAIRQLARHVIAAHAGMAAPNTCTVERLTTGQSVVPTLTQASTVRACFMANAQPHQSPA